MPSFYELIQARSDVVAYYPLVAGDIGDDYGPNARNAVTVANINTVAGPYASENVADAGTNPNIELPVALCTDISAEVDFSIIAWVKIAHTNTFRAAMVLPNSDGVEGTRLYIAAGVNADRMASSLRPQPGDTSETANDAFTVGDDVWNLVVVRYDFSANRIYITTDNNWSDFDSVTFDSSTFTLGDPTGAGGSRPTLFKRTVDTQSDAYWDGALCHVALFNTFVSDVDAQAFADATSGLAPSFTALLVKQQASYGLLASLFAKQTSDYGVLVNAAHQASHSMAGFHVKQQSSYGISQPIYVKHASDYAIETYDQVLAKQQASHAMPIIAKQEASHGISTPLYAKHATDYELSGFNTVLAKQQASHALPIIAKQETNYASTLPVLAKQPAEYGLLDGVLAKHETSYEGLTFNRVVAKQQSSYLLRDDATIFTDIQDHYVTIGGRRIEVQNANVSMDEGDLGWNASITLARRNDAALFATNTEFSLVIGATTWTLKVDRVSDPYEVTSSGISADITVSAKSPALFEVGVFAETTDIEYTSTIFAEAAAEDIAQQTIDWQLLDWPIAGGALAFEDTTRLDAVKAIVEAVGGNLHSNPDGTLTAISKSPVAVPSMPTTAATDVDDRVIYSRQMVNSHAIGINSIIVYDLLPVTRDLMEAEDTDDPHIKIVKAYPSPYRTLLTVTTTNSNIRLYGLGVTTETKTETDIEVREGQFSTSYPIFGISSSDYQTNNLGALQFDRYGNQVRTATKGYSLIDITYTTRVLRYRAYNRTEEPLTAQMLLNDLAVTPA